MKHCEICGEPIWFFRKRCDDCLRKEASLKNALKLGATETVPVELNGLLAYLFTKDEIERILIEAITDADAKHIEAFCMDADEEFEKVLEGETE